MRNEGSETILIVEDDSGIRQLVSTVLQSAAYQVLECGKGDDALVMFRENEHRVGLVLTDLVMPETGGVMLAAKTQGNQSADPYPFYVRLRG